MKLDKILSKPFENWETSNLPWTRTGFSENHYFVRLLWLIPWKLISDFYFQENRNFLRIFHEFIFSYFSFEFPPKMLTRGKVSTVFHPYQRCECSTLFNNVVFPPFSTVKNFLFWKIPAYIHFHKGEFSPLKLKQKSSSFRFKAVIGNTSRAVLNLMKRMSRKTNKHG